MKSITLDSEFNSQNESSSILNNLEPMERITLESNYIKANINAFQLIRNRNYQKATESYEICINIAKKLDDNYKIRDSICNYAISLFYNGKLEKSLENLKKVYKQTLEEQNLRIKNRMQNSIDLKSLVLDLKILSNLTIAYLSLNKLDDSMSIFNTLCTIIEGHENLQTKLILIKNVLYNFFRVDSIMTIDEYFNQKIIVDENSSDKNEVHKNIIRKIINAFHSYLKNNNINVWIDCLNEEIENLKILKDYNGIIFVIFNLESSIYIKSINENDDKNKQSSLSKFSSLIKALMGEKNLEENKVNSILNFIKNKMEQAVKMYNKLYYLESNATMNCKNQELYKSKTNSKSLIDKNNINSTIFLQILLKYAINYVNSNISDQNLCKQIKSQIDMTSKILSNKEINHSQIKLSNLSPEITKALIILFNNLFSIYTKCKLKNYFNLYKTKINREKSQERSKYLNNIIHSYYKGIQLGDSILKINLNSYGTKTHFYRLNYDNDTIQIYKKDKDNKIDKEISINSIIKIIFGINSSNLKKKIKTLPNINQPWLYMSFISKDTSIDLYLNENQIRKWFYGLSNYLNIIRKRYKIVSKSKYIINRCKMKMANDLINYSKKDLISDSNANIEIKNLNPIGNSNISFIKLLLLYNKISK